MSEHLDDETAQALADLVGEIIGNDDPVPPALRREDDPDGPDDRRDAEGRLLCTSLRSDGQPCQMRALPGLDRCSRHSGVSPRARARLSLLDSQDFAVRVLIREAGNTQTGSPTSRIKAAEAILDRGGNPRGVRVEQAEALTVLQSVMETYRGEAIDITSLSDEEESR